MTLDPQTFLHGTPTDIRLRLLNYLRDQYAGDTAFFGTLASDEQGWVAAGATPVGPPEFVAKWKATDGVRLRDQGVDLEYYWEFNRFSLRNRSTEPPAVVDGWWKPFDLVDAVGINVARDQRYIGYLAIYRTARSPRFTDADVRRVTESERLVRHVLEAADALAAATAAPVGAHVLDPDGRLLFTVSASPGNATTTSALEEPVRAFLANRGPGELLVGQSLVSMSQLQGASGRAALVIVRPVRESTVPDILRLTRLKRSIAIFAAAGATTSEIATALHRKPETVRAHLKEIYLRLGINSRVELAELVERARTNAPK